MTSADPRHELGRRGEDLAADFFERRGYAVAARNWRCPYGELDLVVFRASDGDLRAIEVKTRQGNPKEFRPYEVVTSEKLDRIGEALARFLEEHPELPQEAHFDVLAITFIPGSVPVFQWVQDFE